MLLSELHRKLNMLEMTEMKIKKLMPVDAESRRLIDWMEKGTIKLLSNWTCRWRFCVACDAFFLFFSILFIDFAGVYDALQKKYLKTLLFCVCEAVDGPMLEEYACKAITHLIAILVRGVNVPEFGNCT